MAATGRRTWSHMRVAPPPNSKSAGRYCDRMGQGKCNPHLAVRALRAPLLREGDELGIAAQEPVERVASGAERGREAVQLLAALAGDLVRAAVRAGLRRLPSRPHETLVLESAQRSVQPARVRAAEPERLQSLEQVIAVRGVLAQQEEDRRAQEVLR